MKKQPSLPILAGLLLLGVYLWMRDRSWMVHQEDALPILLGLPLFLFLVAPVRWAMIDTAEHPHRVETTFSLLGGVLFALGLTLNVNLLLALAWVALFWGWLGRHFAQETRQRALRLLPLLALSFPWLLLDGEAIGWWFRLSGACVTSELFRLVGFAVERQGTLMSIQGVTIGVDAPCAGLNVLQSLLLAGTALAFVTPGGRRWHPALLQVFLVTMAWGANVLRLILLSVAALTYGIPFAKGLFHTWGGLLALLLMFLLCVGFFTWNGKPSKTPEATEVPA